MRVISFDTETKPTEPGLKAPPMACLTWQCASETRPNILHGRDPAAREVFRSWIYDPEVMLVGHFAAYDFAVCANAWPEFLPAIYDKFAANLVTDTMLREKLWDIALGEYRTHDYDLGATARRRAGLHLKKDGYRMQYGNFLDIPLEAWPARAALIREQAIAQVAMGVKDKDLEAIATGDPSEILTYPLDDARATLASWQGQERLRADCEVDVFADEFRQAQASWWLTLMCNYGLRTREEGIRLLEIQTDEMIRALEGDLITSGLIRPDGSRDTRDTKKAAARMLDVCGWQQTVTLDANNRKQFSYTKTRDDAIELRKTKSNDVSLDRDACKACDDDILVDYGDLAQQKAVRDKDIPMLRAGTVYPVHTRIDLVNSGRTSSSAPNIQNLRRLPGIREAFIPRPGYVFAQVDYPGLELRTLAQVCIDLFGFSRLGDMINAGMDPHLAFAAEKVLNIPYEEAKKDKKRKDVDDARQIGKVFNFGSPGGLGAEKLCTFARKTYGVTLNVADAKKWKRLWLETFPEMRRLFDHVGNMCQAVPPPPGEDDVKPQSFCDLMQVRSGRIRGRCTYTAGCNTLFQGLGADATKAAGFVISRGCYVDRSSPLFGSRIVAYVHDEFILEVRDDNRAHDAATELARVACVEANKWLPNVPFLESQMEPLLMRLWSKEAAPIHHYQTKRLVPWEPALAGMMNMGKAVNDLVKARPYLLVAA